MSLPWLCMYVWMRKFQNRDSPPVYTDTAKNISTLAILSENATLLSENCCSCKCFGTRMFIFFLFALEQQKKQKKSQICYNSTKLLAPLT